MRPEALVKSPCQRADPVSAASTSALCYLISIFPNSPEPRNLMLLFALFHRPLANTGRFWSAAAWLVNLIKPLTGFILIPSPSQTVLRVVRLVLRESSVSSFIIGFSMLRLCREQRRLCVFPIWSPFVCFSCLVALARAEHYGGGSGILAFL